MSLLESIFTSSPFVALFITLALGYLVGKITIGRFVLGGVAGTLLVGVMIGQFGVEIDAGVKSIFFALFIYAVGFAGGPQFFSALNRRTINVLLSAVAVTVFGLLTVLAFAYWFELDRGTAAGLAAGGLTQSAIIGTAGDAIGKLGGVTEEAKHLMQTNVAVGYAVTYIFGSLGPILMVSIIPAMMGWDLRKEALKLAEANSDGKPELNEGEFNALTQLAARAYQVNADSAVLGHSLAEVNQALIDLSIQLIERDGQALERDDEAKITIQAGDILVVTGRRKAVQRYQVYLGEEVEVADDMVLVEESRKVIANQPHLIGKTLAQISAQTNRDMTRGVYLTDFIRGGKSIEITPDLVVRKNDMMQFAGSPKDINRIENNVGRRLGSSTATDFIFFGAGMALGLVFGLINFKIAGIPVTIGSGAGCLASGLLMGWLRSRNPNVAAFPVGASNFIRDLGLAVFVGIVGLQAGPGAIAAIQEHGLSLLLMGVGVTMIPQFLGFFFSYYVLRIKNPVEAMGCLIGARSANPGFAALLEKTGNSTPTFSFTVTYAVANVLLTLWGPIIVGIITLNVAI
ncbi:aspartate-alanine antiporter [Ferrimonas marina]|uniref:Aspartate-alanine antiporter n=1 Tax=Ferrimonas marina TaxID=299255 RepID=A0A1M5RCU7_9GAMM|nr:aspartate-alanine antiporter [Ferrimonas marina]SHH24172.1 aspartate-alanine antiporter [Ferrimonas marina]